MNKNFKVITINGIRGIIVAIFVVLGLIAGFVISPGWVCMKLWNAVFEQSNTVALMNLFQGVMLWAIIALTLYALNNKRSLIGFGSYSYPALSQEQIRDIMERARNTHAKIINESDDILNEIDENKITDEHEENISIIDKTEEVRK